MKSGGGGWRPYNGNGKVKTLPKMMHPIIDFLGAKPSLAGLHCHASLHRDDASMALGQHLAWLSHATVKSSLLHWAPRSRALELIFLTGRRLPQSISSSAVAEAHGSAWQHDMMGGVARGLARLRLARRRASGALGTARTRTRCGAYSRVLSSLSQSADRCGKPRRLCAPLPPLLPPPQPLLMLAAAAAPARERGGHGQLKEKEARP